ncbi:MAG: hypothetical protein HY791_10410 [Deltaproteobacteria bacterium]|nr:hypothetical protein [Deltaproteobacteria bacterium]
MAREASACTGSIVSEGRTLATLEPPIHITDMRDFGADPRPRYVQEADPNDEGAVSRAKICELVEAGRGAEARKFIETAKGDLGEWPHVLAPPRAMPGPPKPASGRGDPHLNMNWLKEHCEAYRGVWVALRDGKLIDVDESWDALDARLGAAGARSNTLMANVDQLWPLGR